MMHPALLMPLTWVSMLIRCVLSKFKKEMDYQEYKRKMGAGKCVYPPSPTKIDE